MKIGIIGAESSHSHSYCKTINIDNLFPDFEISHIWGETKDLAENCSKKFNVPTIATNQEDMIGEIDALIVVHKNGKYNLKAATKFIDSNIPIFIDKPFCTNVKETNEFITLCNEYETVFTSFGVQPLQKDFLSIKKDIETSSKIFELATYGYANFDDPNGGIFFYGFHQLSLILDLLGNNVNSVETLQADQNIKIFLYNSTKKIASINIMPEEWKSVGFYLHYANEKGYHSHKLVYDDHIYLPGIEKFLKMFTTKQKPYTDEEILAPIAILEAIEKSYISSQKMNVY
ncbi:MAG: hypothetical protein COA79_01615 [Planctomycetota bacterium]|nr:MAG: hypothetical protein COA79_01615 [Planctomycetota bacterium]